MAFRDVLKEADDAHLPWTKVLWDSLSQLMFLFLLPKSKYMSSVRMDSTVIQFRIQSIYLQP